MRSNQSARSFEDDLLNFDKTAVNLNKIDGDWKVDASEIHGFALFNAMGKAVKEVTDEINAGKYKTAAEAKDVLEQKWNGGGMKK